MEEPGQIYEACVIVCVESVMHKSLFPKEYVGRIPSVPDFCFFKLLFDMVNDVVVFVCVFRICII